MIRQLGQMKKWKVLGISVAVLGIGLWGAQSSSTLKAEAEKSFTQKEGVKENETRVSSTQTQMLSAISNEKGLSAKPKVVQIAQNKTFPKDGNSKDDLQQLVTDLIIPESSSGVKWRYVNEKGSPVIPSSAKSGFQKIYVEITENADSSSIQVPVPITVTDETISIIEGDIAYRSRALSIIKMSEVIDGTPEEISTQLKEHLGIEAWNMITGEDLPITISDLDGLTKTSGITTYNFTYTITKSDKEMKTIDRAYTLLADNMLNDSQSQSLNRFSLEQEKEGWTEVPLGSTEGIVSNPINESKLGFINRGLTIEQSGGGNAGFAILDKDGRNFVFGGWKVASVPYVNGKLLYSIGSVNTANKIYKTNGLGYTTSNSKLTTQLFLKKGNALKEVLIDDENQIAYVYNLTLSRNLNFSIKLSMYNLSSGTRSFGMVETVDTKYVSDMVPLYALGGNKGFYMEPEPGLRFTIKLKNELGQNFSEYTMQAPGNYGTAIPIGPYAGAAYNLSSENWFRDDFSRSGIEQYNRPKDFVIIKNIDSAYQLGAPNRPVAMNESLDVGYEMFVGNELPYMKLKTVPEEFNVYQDTLAQEFKSNYILSDVPSMIGFGNIYITYPNEQTTKVPFDNPNTNLETSGFVTIPRGTLPEKLNDNPGTIKNYTTMMTAVYEKDDPKNGLPSNDHIVKINAYNLGAKAIAQVVRKGSAWTKPVSSLITDPVVLPDHTADFKYVNPTQPVDTSKVGLQYAEVCMTDLNEPTRTTVIKVPVMVMEGTLPTKGLMIGANDFSSNKAEIASLTDEQLKAFILKKSEAIAWDIETGLSEGIDLSVSETTLTNLNANESNTAVIQAKKGSTIVTKAIQIKLTAKLTINFLDEVGKPLHEPYTDTKEVGEIVDLNQIKGVTEILNELLKNNYDLTKPDHEIITIIGDGNTVNYHFNGTLKILSAPSILDFGSRTAIINAVKFTDPKIIGDPLVISDTRAQKVKWSLKAKVDQPLTSLENAQIKLPDSIKYRYQDDELSLTDENIVIFSHLNASSGIYDVTKERWAKGDGFMLDLEPGAIKILGKYQARITITLENAK